jgi:plastocyanin
MKRALVSMLTPIALAGLVAGCGSSKEATSTPATTSQSTPATTTAPAETTPAPSSGESGSSSLSLEANPEGQLKYNTTSLTAKAGKVSIDFSNSSPVGHNVTIESSSGAAVGATPTFQGGSKTLTLNLKPGTYKFFCSVPGHRMAGMEGTLVVK